MNREDLNKGVSFDFSILVGPARGFVAYYKPFVGRRDYGGGRGYGGGNISPFISVVLYLDLSPLISVFSYFDGL